MVDLIPAPRASLAAAANREKKLADMLAALTDHYDYVFLDCPPAQGLLTPNALCAAERVLIPVELSPFAFDGVVQPQDTMVVLGDGYDIQFAAEHGGSAVSSRPAAVGRTS